MIGRPEQRDSSKTMPLREDVVNLTDRDLTLDELSALEQPTDPVRLAPMPERVDEWRAVYPPWRKEPPTCDEQLQMPGTLVVDPLGISSCFLLIKALEGARQENRRQRELWRQIPKGEEPPQALEELLTIAKARSD